MELFTIIAILMVCTALFNFLNYKFLKMPSTIGVMLIALTLSLVLLIIERVIPGVILNACHMVRAIDFKTALMQVMLSFLIFAGAFNMNTQTLMQERLTVLVFAVVSTLISTFIIGIATYYIFQAIGIPIAFINALLFGALISPTDPIAVMAILRQANVSPSLEMDIAGESLLNDGVAVVIFTTIFEMAGQGTEQVGVSDVVLLFVREALGGATLGLLIGYIGYLFLKHVHDAKLDLMITLAVVMGGYSLAASLEVSGPLAVVAAGLYMGAQRKRVSSEEEREQVDIFREMVDEILNAVLFILIGLEVLLIPFDTIFLKAGLIAIMLVLGARFLSVILSIPLTKLRHEKSVFNTILVLTWGGLRGGISVALALSLTENMQRDFIVAITYTVVIFSIMVQGLSIGKLVKKLGLSN